MRLDLFLKTSRLIKRRTIAREMCDSGRVLVNGHEAKPAKEVKTGDTVTLMFTSRIIDLEVAGLPSPTIKKIAPEDMYRVKSETRVPRENDRWNENL